MHLLYYTTGLALLLSWVKDRETTFNALKIAYKKFINILPAFLTMLICISLILFLIPDKMILHYLGNNNKFVGVAVATVFGSVTLMPGFISYPLAGILLKKGVSYMVLSAFTTTLMMVGVLTYPVEKEYFGAKVTIIRNLISLFITVIIAISIGFFFGELL